MKLLKIIILTVFLFPVLFVGILVFIITIDIKIISDFINPVFGNINTYYFNQLEIYVNSKTT